MKKISLVLVIALVAIFAITACAAPAPAPTASEAPASEAPASEAPASEAPASEAPASEAPAEAPAMADLNIQVIAKGFQHAFWQAVKLGAEQAATELGVTMEFNGPEGESAIATQVDMLNGALAKKPSGIVLAALDTEAVASQLQQAQDAKIPVVGFDSGVPDAPAGQIAATASTDNAAAAALAAQEMMKDTAFADKIKAATKDAPVTVAVFSQDVTSASIIGRTEGFINEFKKLAEAAGAQVAVTGNDKYKVENPEATVNIEAVIPATPDAVDMKNGAIGLLNTKGLIGVFCSNEGAVTGLLNATNDGSDLDREKGKYKDLVVAGFDAGATQKQAVKNGWFLGAVTQDPVRIGYLGVELAAKAAMGETVADVDTGAKWYTKDNMDQEDIAVLLYD